MRITPITMHSPMPIMHIVLSIIMRMLVLRIMPIMHITSIVMLICMIITPMNMHITMPIMYTIMHYAKNIIMHIMHITLF